MPSSTSAKKKPSTLVLAQPYGAGVDAEVSRALVEVLRRYPLEPTMILSGDASVEECASNMKEHGLSGVLISEAPNSIDGLFTDRDLFSKMNSKVAADLVWSAPIRTVMSRQVVTVSPDAIHLAPAMMAQHKLRHLPVIMKTLGGQPRVLGMLTMDSIFQQNVQVASGFRDYSSAPVATNPVGVLSDDKFMALRVCETLAQMGNPMVRTIRRAETMLPNMLQALAEGFRNLVIDVDGYDVKKLGRLLKLILASARMQKIVLVFTKEGIEMAMSNLLKQLSNTPPFFLVAKPLEARELVTLFQPLERTRVSGVT